MIELQIMYAAAIGGAGIVGAAILLAPLSAARFIWLGEPQSEPAGRLVGALWFGIGLVAILGLQEPVAYLPLLLLQLVYKSLWLLFVAVPALLTGRMTRPLSFFTILFAIWAVALAFVLWQSGWAG